MSGRNGNGNGLGSLLNEKILTDIIASKVREIATPVITVEIREAEQIQRTLTGTHEKFPSLLYLISKGHHVYLWGPPGSGKSTAAHQCAQALERGWGYISLNPQTPESRLLGFIDAGGTYRPTPFYKAYTEGGVFCIDEVDNASPALVTTLNSLLENGNGAFPNGVYPRHKNFVLVATGNTAGRGANILFPDRRPFDGAFAERFTFLQWGYDEALEKSVTLAINPRAEKWLKWVREVRDYCHKNEISLIVSPRASFKGADYLKEKALAVADIAESLIFKGLEESSREAILKNCPLPEVPHA